jgi:hypothetical protein
MPELRAVLYFFLQEVHTASHVWNTESTYSIIRRFFHESKNKLPAPERAEPKVSFDVGANDVAMMRAVFIIFLTVVCECAAAARCRANVLSFLPFLSHTY